MRDGGGEIEGREREVGERVRGWGRDREREVGDRDKRVGERGRERGRDIERLGERGVGERGGGRVMEGHREKVKQQKGWLVSQE